MKSNIVDLEKIKDLRKKKGLNRVEMAKHLTLTEYGYRSKELGYRKFTIEEIYILSKFFNVSIEDLLIKEAK